VHKHNFQFTSFQVSPAGPSPAVVVHAGAILEKPESAAQARAFIAGYSVSPAGPEHRCRPRHINSPTSSTDVVVQYVWALSLRRKRRRTPQHHPHRVVVQYGLACLRATT
jgi:hypothetical protein